MSKQIINGFEVCIIDDKLEFLCKLDGLKKILIAINAEKVINKDPLIMKLTKCHLAYPDGVGVSLAMQRKGFKTLVYPGVELWLDVVNFYYKTKSFYLIGSTQKVIEGTVAKLKNEFDEINILGYKNGYINSVNEIAKEIFFYKPDIIFIAQGSPLQEINMNELYRQYPAMYVGLGGSFDIYVGDKTRAPKIFRKFGLEWFYRLVNEPTRIRRQLALINFAIRILFNKI